MPKLVPLQPNAQEGRSMNARKISHKKQSRARGIDVVEFLKELLDYIRVITSVYNALSRIPSFNFSSGERISVGRLSKFAAQHAGSVKNGVQLDDDQMKMTLSLARRVKDALEKHYVAFMQGSFTHFDNIMAEIRKIDPMALERNSGKIAELLEIFRNSIADKNTPLDDDVAAYLEVNKLLTSLNREVVRVEDARKKKMVRNTLADEILKELDDLQVA